MTSGNTGEHNLSRAIFMRASDERPHPCRHVILPKPLLKLIPKDYFDPEEPGVLRILSDTEWRGIGITQSLGWEHYEVHGELQLCVSLECGALTPTNVPGGQHRNRTSCSSGANAIIKTSTAHKEKRQSEVGLLAFFAPRSQMFGSSRCYWPTDPATRRSSFSLGALARIHLFYRLIPS